MIKRGVAQGGGVADNAEAHPRLHKKAEASFTIKGYAGVTIRRVDGSVEEIPMQPNIVTKAGFAWIAEKLYDSDSNNNENAYYMGMSKTDTTWVTDNNYTVTELSDTGLTRKRADTENWDAGEKTLVMTQSFTNDTANTVSGINSLTLRNVSGTATTASTLVHIVKLDSAFNLNAGDSVDITWNIVLSEPTS